jgi:hypothetical protein
MTAVILRDGMTLTTRAQARAVLAAARDRRLAGVEWVGCDADEVLLDAWGAVRALARGQGLEAAAAPAGARLMLVQLDRAGVQS